MGANEADECGTVEDAAEGRGAGVGEKLMVLARSGAHGAGGVEEANKPGRRLPKSIL